VPGTRAIWWLRGLVALGLVLFFVLPYRITGWIPIWLPFFAALAVEVQFFVSGWRAAPRSRFADRGAYASYFDQEGRRDWVMLPLRQGAQLWIDPGELGEDELTEWLLLNDAELAALEPDGQFEVGPLRNGEPSEIRPLEPVPFARRRRRLPSIRLVFSIAVLVAVAGLLSLRPSGWERLSAGKRTAAQAQFSRLASGIAGHQVTVHCDTGGRHVGAVQEADGLAEVGGRQAWLTPDICLQLVQLRDGDLRADSDTAGHAVVVLAHEAWHLHGVAGEGLANCFAYQTGARIAEQLGVSPGTARALMKAQLAENRVEFAGSPAYFVPPGCHNGGPDDLHPASNRFP
jgi:hypothetical protein